ncbi:MAG: glycosyltransferase family 4 protein [Clostridia bacterium]|nr:glycosyltransferase family 4 protein [Clostridia bacterium]
MKIVHIAASAPYNDYWGYQDNLLPKYHVRLGHDVTVLTTNLRTEGGEVREGPCGDYVLSDGVRVIRFRRKDYGNHILNNLTERIAVFDVLKDISPDVIFFHGLVSSSIYDAVKYKKKINPSCVIIQDNHLDPGNHADGASGIKRRVIRAFHRMRVKRTISAISKVYGVTPRRKRYSEEYFGVPKEKTGVLIMGADDDAVRLAEKQTIRDRIRGQYGISDDAFLIVTGGKIDEPKKIHLLMEAVRGMKDVKLLVFGSVAPGFEERFEEARNDNVIFTGWISSEKTYDYFLASDLSFFPGTHSVLWEQACACKVPCVFAMWDGMDHVDCGGNSSFISPVSVGSIRDEIIRLRFTDEYYRMKSVAGSEATDIYLYSAIAKKSLETVSDA